MMGDINAKVGSISHSNIVGNFGLDDKNGRGESLIQFYEQNQLIITNTWLGNCRENFMHGKGQVIKQEIKLTT